MKKYINDKSPFPQSVDELDGHVLVFEGHDRPRYIYPFNNEAGYLGLDDWGQYWNKPVYVSETAGRLDQTKYYSIVVVPLKTNISVGGIPIYGEATQPSMPQLPSIALRGLSFTIPTHDQKCVKDVGLSYYTESGTCSDESKVWAINEYIGKWIKNVETGVTSEITANTSLVITAPGCSFTGGDRYQILELAATARLIYAAEMSLASAVSTSNYYLAGIVNNNSDTTYTLASFAESADIWDFSAGYLQPPNANSVKSVGGIMFCGGGIEETNGLSKYEGSTVVLVASASANSDVKLSVVDDTAEGADEAKIIRLEFGSALDVISKIVEGSYLTITGASKTANNVINARILRVDPAGKWVEIQNNSAETNSTITVTTPFGIGTGNGTISTPSTTPAAKSEQWELTCAGLQGIFISRTPVANGGNTGNGTITTPICTDLAKAETWTLHCTSVEKGLAPENISYASGGFTPIGTGVCTIPTVNQATAVPETWTLTCTHAPEQVTIASRSLSNGFGAILGNGTVTVPEPIQNSGITNETWTIQCTSTATARTTEVISTPSGKGGVSIAVGNGSSIITENWTLQCIGASVTSYISSFTLSYAGSFGMTATASATAGKYSGIVTGSGVWTMYYNDVSVGTGTNGSSRTYNGVTMTFFGPNIGVNVTNCVGYVSYYPQVSTFNVSSLSSGISTTATAGTPCVINNYMTFTIGTTGTAWASGDTILLKTTKAAIAPATFSVTSTVNPSQNNLLSVPSSASPYYECAFFRVQVVDGSIPFQVGDKITFTPVSEYKGGATFIGQGSVTPMNVTVTSGASVNNTPYFSISVSDSSVSQWKEGNQVIFDIAYKTLPGAKFSATGLTSLSTKVLTTGLPYTNEFFSCFVSDGTTAWEEDDEITFDVYETIGDGETFTVLGERSGFQPPITIGEAYSNLYFSTEITAGNIPFVLGDKFYFSTSKTPTELSDTSMTVSMTPNYIQGNTTYSKTRFSEGLQDALFKFTADNGAPYRISWVDPITQRVGLATKYEGFNTDYATAQVKSDYSLYYSDSRNPHRIRSGSIVDIGDRITCLSSVSDNILVFCENSLLRVSVESLGAAPVLISDNIRCPAPFSVVKGEKLVMFYDGTGFSITDGVTVTSVTAYKLKDYLSNLNKEYEANIRGVYDRESKRFEFVFALGTDTLNNYGVYITEDTWNCYPFTRPDCNALWTNYADGNLRVYHGTSGELASGNGIIWKHSGDSDGTENKTLTVVSMSGQVVNATCDSEVTLAAGDVLSVYPVASGQEVKQLIIKSIESAGFLPIAYNITFSDQYGLTEYVAGDLLLSGYVPFDYGIKWTDFASPQYRHQVRALHIDFENMNGTLYVDHFLDMNKTPVATNEYPLTSADTKLIVPFRMGKSYKYGFRLRGYSSTGIKISSFEIMYDTQA